MLIKPRIKLSHNIIQVFSNEICIGEIPKHAFRLQDITPEYLYLIDLLDGTRTIPRIIKKYNEKYPEVKEEEILNAINSLYEHHLIDDAGTESEILSNVELELYDRQILLYSMLDKQHKPGFFYQEMLKRKVVGVFGMGGWGTWISVNLALNGVGKLRIVDGDTIEVSNLNRQILYSHPDIGSPKVDAAKKSLNRVNPNVEVDPIFQFVLKDEGQIEELMSGLDMLFLCWANLAYFLPNTTEEIILKHAFNMKIPVLEVAADPFNIAVGPIFINNGLTPCFNCIKEQFKETVFGDDPEFLAIHAARFERKFRNGNRTVNAWQTSPSLSIMSGMASDQAIKFLSGIEQPFLQDKRFTLSLSNFESKTYTYTRRPDCEWCGK